MIYFLSERERDKKNMNGISPEEKLCASKKCVKV